MLHSVTFNTTRQVWLFVMTVVMLFASVVSAQDPNDCEGAVLICDDGPVSYTPQGPGNFDFSNTICGTTEHQSAWYYFAFANNMPPNSIIEFTINPNPINIDYDFAIWGPNVSCSDLDAAGMIRCNFSGMTGPTGLNVGGVGGTFEDALVVNPGEGFYLLVDNFSQSSTGFSMSWGGSAAPFLDCTADPPCTLQATTEADFTICEGESFDLIGQSTGGTGMETYRWRVNPSSLVVYISDTTALTTDVQFPFGLNETEAVFTLVIIDDNCTASSTITVTIDERVRPQFFMDTTYCDDDDEIVLPQTSDDGFQGSWSPPSINPALGPGSYMSFFTPNANQAGCPDTTSIRLIIEPTLTPEFLLPDTFCENENPYVLPNVSDNDIAGTWNPSSIDPFTSAGQTIIATFTPLEDGCFTETTAAFTIKEAFTPTFDLELTICEGALPFLLDDVSLEGIEGSWSMPVINPMGQAGSFLSSTFVPDDLLEECYTTYTHEWFVTSSDIPDFLPVADLCVNGNVLVLPEISLDGIRGTWSIPIIDPTGSPPTTIISVFTPEVGSCASTYEQTIQIVNPPEFGTVSATNPSDCGQADGTISITSVQQDVVFSIDGGTTWQSAGIFTGLGSGTHTILISPVTNNACIRDTSIMITSPGTPDFIAIHSKPITDCYVNDGIIIVEADGQSLEYSIDNGMSWQPDSIFEQLSAGTYTITVRSSTSPSCVSNTTTEVTSPELISIDSLVVHDVTDCSQSDGQVICFVNGDNLEYTIDGGLSWQDTSWFANLAAGTYTLIVRGTDRQSCSDSLDFTIQDASVIRIDTVEVFHLSDCQANDGIIRVLANGDQLEYSIDGGQTWQADSVFSALTAGLYDVLVRRIDAKNCTDMNSVSITAPNAPLIQSIVTQDVTDCTLADGSVQISAMGMELEYSLDGGVTWQMDSIFSGLMAGDYGIVIRSRIATNCFVEQQVSIDEPMLPEIESVIVADVTDCIINNGRLEVLASVANGPLEYSLDELNWQASPVFLDLAAGTYTVFVRRLGSVHCRAEETIVIRPLIAPVIDSIAVEPQSDCGAEDAVLSVISTLNSLEYSIDSGMTWQLDANFIGLGAGSYPVFIRLIGSESCFDFRTVAIEDTPCDCSQAEFDMQSTNPDCHGDATGAAQVRIMPESIDATVLWSTGSVNPDLNQLVSGVYTVTVTYFDACVFVDSIDISEPEPLFLDFDVLEASCADATDGGLEIRSVSGGNGDYSLLFDQATVLPDVNSFVSLPPGDHNFALRDSSGCTALYSATVIEKEEPEFSISGQTTYYVGDTIRLELQGSAGQFDDVVWSDRFGEILSVNPLFEFVAKNDMEIEVLVNYGECFLTQNVAIEVRVLSIFFPTGFSPNDDGINDSFYPFQPSDHEPVLYDMQIFDRWGSLVYEVYDASSDNPEMGWKGQRSGKPLDNGVFIYSSTVYLSDGKTRRYKGDIQLLK